MSLEPKKTWQSVWWWFLKKSTAKETLGKSWKVYTLYFNGFARVAWHEVLALVQGSWWMAGEMSERWGYSWGKSLYNLNIIEICYDMLLCRKKKKRVMSKGIRFLLGSKFKKDIGVIEAGHPETMSSSLAAFPLKQFSLFDVRDLNNKTSP